MAGLPLAVSLDVIEGPAASGVELPLIHSRLFPAWCGNEADAWLACLRCELDWQTEDIMLFGKFRQVPRLSAFYGDSAVRYRYSGVLHHALAWHPLLERIRDRLASELSLRFNAVLANRYRDGSDCVGWHSDDEADLGPDPVIASLSLGAARPFKLRHRWGLCPDQCLELEHGSLLLMLPPCQREWQHCLPRRKRIRHERINLSYRLLQDGGS